MSQSSCQTGQMNAIYSPLLMGGKSLLLATERCATLELTARQTGSASRRAGGPERETKVSYVLKEYIELKQKRVAADKRGKINQHVCCRH